MNIFNYIYRSLSDFKFLIMGMLFCILLIAIDGNLRPYIIKLIIDQASHFNLESFVKLSSIFVLSQLVMVISNAIFDWLGTLFHTSYRSYTLHKFFDKISNYEYKFFEETQSGTITARISDAFNTIPIIVFTSIRVFVNFIFYVIVAIAVLSQVNQLFVVAMLIWITIFIFCAVVLYYKYEPLNRVYAKVRPKIYGFLSDYFSNILTVKYFGNQEFEKNQFKNLTDEFVEKSTKCGVFLRNYYALYGIIVAIYMLVIISILGNLLMNQKISAGDFVLVFMVNYKIVDLLFEISNTSREFVTNCSIVSNAIQILDYKGVAIDTQNPPYFYIKKGDISFNNVCFGYSDNYIFKNISLQIKHGEKIGLVGYSGSGKTSFIKLLLRLYEVNEGEIIIDGKNIKDISRQSLMDAIAIAMQEPSLFHRTILENINYGKMDASEQEIHKVIADVKADAFISQLKDGYQTLVGERGVKLSGGQKQRIAIARAILKNTPIFILDEATSQLDSVTENYIQKNLDEIIKDKTALIIAHRLSTLMQVDRLIVFDEGQIVEDGTREELLAKNGIFTKLWDAQVDGFLPTKKTDLDLI